MANFDVGETVICSCEVRDDAGTLVDPSTSMKITIIGQLNNIIINDVDMTKDSVGKYHYDFASGSNVEGNYIIKYKATNGTRITIEKETFILK